ncbi:PRS53 protease, partial [Anseranas semipalmata]|nr:PRS53 protease [Anseranas semipalmata]
QLEAGSPLACEERGIWFLVGTASGGGCAEGGPPLFTAVSLYERWITSVTREAYFAEPPPDPSEAEEPDDFGDPSSWGPPEPTENPNIRGSPKPVEDLKPSEDPNIRGSPKPSEDP